MNVILTRVEDFRTNLKRYLDAVLGDDQVVAVYRSRGKNVIKNTRVVLITLEEFEALRKAAGQAGKGLLTSKAAAAAAAAATPPPPPPDLTFQPVKRSYGRYSR